MMVSKQASNGTPKRTAARKTTKRQSYLEVVGTGERILVPDDPAGERAAVAASPVFRRMHDRAMKDVAEGRTVPLEELRRQMDEEDAREGRGPLPTGRRPTAPNGKLLLRLPLSVHRELIERAASEQTSLNQLALAYISRGLGEDASAH